MSQVEDFFRFVKAMKRSLWLYGRQPGFRGRAAPAEHASGNLSRDLDRSWEEMRRELGVGAGAERRIRREERLLSPTVRENYRRSLRERGAGGGVGLATAADFGMPPPPKEKRQQAMTAR